MPAILKDLNTHSVLELLSSISFAHINELAQSANFSPDKLLQKLLPPQTVPASDPLQKRPSRPVPQYPLRKTAATRSTASYQRAVAQQRTAASRLTVAALEQSAWAAALTVSPEKALSGPEPQSQSEAAPAAEHSGADYRAEMSDTGGTAGRGDRGGTAGRAVSADTAVRDGTADSPALTCDVRTIALTMDSLAHACALGGVYLNDIIMAACIEYSRGKLSQSGRQDQVLEVTARIRALDAALCRLINLAVLLSSTVCASDSRPDHQRSAAVAGAKPHDPASTGRYSAAYSGSRAPHADHSATYAGRPARHQHPAARSGKSLALCRYQTKTISGQPHLRSLSDRQPSPGSGWASVSFRASGPYLTGDSSAAMSALSTAAGESGAAVHIAAVRAADTPAADAADGALSVKGESAIKPVSVLGRACASSRAGTVVTCECSAPVRSGQSNAGPGQTAGRTAAAAPSARHASSGALSVASKGQDAAADHDSCDRAWSELAAVLAHYACVLFKEASDLGSQLPQWWQTVKWDFSSGCELAQHLKQQLYCGCTEAQSVQRALPEALEQAEAAQTSVSASASAAAEKMAEKSGAAAAAASADAMETVSTQTLTDRATVRSRMDSILSAHRLLCLRPLPYWLTQCFPRMDRWVRSIKGSEPSRSDLIFARKLKQICPAGTYLMGYDPNSPLN